MKSVAISFKIPGAKKVPFPKTIKPMLATLVDRPPEKNHWIYEIKWDGYRAISLCNKENVNILSRNNKSFNEKYYPLYNTLKKLKLNVVLDGEIVVLNEKGISNFSALQNWRSEADGDLVYYVFDLLWLNGYDVMSLPLVERRMLLEKILPKTEMIRLSESFEGDVESFLQAAKKSGLEGLMAKNAESTYQPGTRGYDWLKIKIQKRHEVVIGGYTVNENTPKLFSSLLVGVYNKHGLQYIGKVGTGFNEKMQKELMAKFKPLKTNRCPFTFAPDVNQPSRFRPNPPHAEVFWLQPKLVCEVSYTELTNDGIMRHPSFEGMREDKDSSDVHPEVTKRMLNDKKNSPQRRKGR